MIITRKLSDYLERNRESPDQIELPIGIATIRVIRRRLGHNLNDQANQWWVDRLGDLSNLTVAEFAKKYNRKRGAVERARLLLVGKKLRDQFWWRSDPARSILLSDIPQTEKAANGG